MSTAPPPASPAPRARPGRQPARPRRIHPIRVLARLRTAMLVAVACTAALSLLVPLGAGGQRAELRRTQQSIDDVKHARTAAAHAAETLEDAFDTGEVALTGTGNDFANATARVSTYITSAAEGNAAGARGLTQIQFVQAQLTICVQLANAAVRDAAENRNTGLEAAAGRALTDGREQYDGRGISGTGGLRASLGDLLRMEQDARRAQEGSFWLNPVTIWALPTAPAAVLLALAAATARVMTRRFRSSPGRGLGLAVLLTAGVPVALGLLAGHPDAPPHTGPPTLAGAVLLLAVAGVLAQLAPRPLLNEYRFRQT